MSLKIKIGEREMTLEEAREIYTELKQLFDGQDATPYVPPAVRYPQWQDDYPYVVPPSPSVPQQPWYSPYPVYGSPTITC